MSRIYRWPTGDRLAKAASSVAVPAVFICALALSASSCGGSDDTGPVAQVAPVVPALAVAVRRPVVHVHARLLRRKSLGAGDEQGLHQVPFARGRGDPEQREARCSCRRVIPDFSTRISRTSRT